MYMVGTAASGMHGEYAFMAHGTTCANLILFDF
jgi:hypothetical protein